MTHTVSVSTMIEQIDGLRGTSDLSDWEDGFVESISQRYHAAGKNTTQLSEAQIITIERVWRKHFA